MVRSLLPIILLAGVTLPAAQNVEDRSYKLTVDVELVQLPVSVLDKHGLSVPGLPPESFRVYEDKVLQDISLFKQEDVALSVGLLIDASGSMRDKLDRLKTATTAFTKASNPEDQTAILTFGDELVLEQDFADNNSNLSRALMNIPPNRGTALYDAVFRAARYLERNASHEKKVLLVVSDGEDNKSKYDLKQVLKAVSESKVIVYTVGLLGSGLPSYGIDGGTAKKSLQQLASVTGGAAFFPKNIDQVAEMCATIARDLRSQYTIGYQPSNRNLDGSWRRVVVRVKPPKNTPSLKVRTKQGYYAPQLTRDPLRESIQ